MKIKLQQSGRLCDRTHRYQGFDTIIMKKDEVDYD